MPNRPSNTVVNNRFFRDIFDASPIGIVVETLEGQPLFINPAFCAMLGFTKEELRGKHCVDFSPPEDAQKDWAFFQKLRAGSIDHYQLEKRYFRRDGSLVWGRLSISLLNNHPSPLVIALVEDISDKKAAEEALVRHAAIVESSEDAIASVTPDGVIVSWNRGAQRIFGYAEGEILGKSVSLLVPPAQLDEENQILETVKAGGRVDQFETVRVTKAGQRIDVSLSISPIRDSYGQIVGCSGIARDITERKRAQEALRASEERLRLSQQAAHLGTFEWNIRTGVDTWTPELEAIYGLSPGGFGGTQSAWEKLVYPEDLAKILQLVDEAVKTGRPTKGEWRVVWPDGSVHWIAGHWQVLMDESDKPLRMVGVNADVTERKQSEEKLFELNRALEAQTAALQSREELLKTFVKNVPAGIAMLDREMRYLQVSDRWCADYGVDASQVLGRSHYELFPDIPPQWKQMHSRALRGETLRADEDHWVRQDGSTVWVRWELRPWATIGREIGGVLILAEDITQRKKMEEALSRMSRKLIDSQEQERTRIARELHDDVSQQLALLAVELDQWDQSSSHDTDLHDRIQNARRRIMEIGQDVQNLSHQLHSSKLEYLGLVAAARSFSKEVSEKNGVRVEFKEDGVPRTLSNEVSLALFRILQQALHNAVAHSGARNVEVRLWEQSNEIHLEVKDLGRGFDLPTALQSTGLGLTSMWERARLVSGEITIDSRPMDGTTIHVRVPFDSEVNSQESGWVAEPAAGVSYFPSVKES
jgi:PAS domain S-box-containing protein